MSIPFPGGSAYGDTDWEERQAEMMYHVAVQLERIADAMEDSE